MSSVTRKQNHSSTHLLPHARFTGPSPLFRPAVVLRLSAFSAAKTNYSYHVDLTCTSTETREPGRGHSHRLVAPTPICEAVRISRRRSSCFALPQELPEAIARRLLTLKVQLAESRLDTTQRSACSKKINLAFQKAVQSEAVPSSNVSFGVLFL
jgi:hypothetical protein